MASNVPTADDAELLRAWKAGDVDAGRALFERCFLALHRFFRGKVEGGVEDLIQDTLTRCLASIDRLRNAASFRAYLFAIARNVLYRRYLDERREGGMRDPGAVPVSQLMQSPSRLLAQRGDQRQLLEALRCIPLDHQVMLELHYWEELTTNNLAEVLEVSASTVKSRLARARELLRDSLHQLGTAHHRLDPTDDGFDAWARRTRDYFDQDA